MDRPFEFSVVAPLSAYLGCKYSEGEFMSWDISNPRAGPKLSNNAQRLMNVGWGGFLQAKKHAETLEIQESWQPNKNILILEDSFSEIILHLKGS